MIRRVVTTAPHVANPTRFITSVRPINTIIVDCIAYVYAALFSSSDSTGRAIVVGIDVL
jgi:hypothetical protein